MVGDPPQDAHVLQLLLRFGKRMEEYWMLGIDHAHSQRLSNRDRAALQYKIWFAMGAALLCFSTGVYKSGIFQQRGDSAETMSKLVIFVFQPFALAFIYALHYSVSLGYGDEYTYIEEFHKWLPNSKLRKFYEKKILMRTNTIQWLEGRVQECVSVRERYESALSKLD